MEYNKIFQDIKKGNIKNLYLFFGQEQYLCEELIRTLKNVLINSIFKDLNAQFLEGDNGTIENIENACETLPFMDEKRLIIVKDNPLFQGGDATGKRVDHLTEYLSKIPTTCCLVFWQKDIDRRKRIFQRLSRIGVVFECKKFRAPELEKWLYTRLNKKGKRIDEKALRYFVENSEYLSYNSTKNLFDIENELNKILDYVGEREVINKEDIEANLPRMLENDIFKLVDAIGKKDRITALKLANDLILQGENEIGILAMIARQFRILLQCKVLMEQGHSTNSIAGRIKERPFVVQKGIYQSRYFDHHSLREALYSVLETDRKMKTGKIDKRFALEMLILEHTR